MASSGTYNFSMSNSDVVLGAYSRIQIRRTSLLAEHMQDAYRQANLLLSEWSNKQPNLFVSEQQTQVLTAGTATYNLPARSIMILSCFIRTGSGQSQNDRMLWPVSEIEYASFANKALQGFPSNFWLNRQIIPNVTFYLTPDDSQVYTAYFQVVRQMQDANLASGETPDLPYRFLDAFEAGLAHRLARIYKPELEQMRKADAAEAWMIAATQDIENVNLVLSPMLGRYFR